MANSGPDTNSSQFFISLNPTSWLNKKHTVFGRVIDGFEICRKAESLKTGAQDKPLTRVTIIDCGEQKEETKLSKSSADFLGTFDGPWPEAAEKQHEM